MVFTKPPCKSCSCKFVLAVAIGDGILLFECLFLLEEEDGGEDNLGGEISKC